MAYTKLPPLGQDTSSDSLPVVIASDQSAVPVTVSGVATSTKQDTIIGHVDGIETVLGTIDADTGNISTKIDTLAGAVAGSEMQVDVLTLPALATGTNTIGSVKLTDGTDVVDVLDLTNSNPLTVAIVDGVGTQITSFGGGNQYTEGDTDATITGTAMLMEGASNTLLPVQGTVADGVLVNLGINNDVTVTGTVSVTGVATSAKQDTGNASLASLDTKLPPQGQALAAASLPVVLTAAQVTTLTPVAAITGYATETTLGTRLSESDFDTKTGSLTETAPASDTASSGLNGRLQRIAQRITSLITAIGSPFQAGASIGNTTFASTQSGTWTVQPGNTANTTAWKVDGSAVTQPVSLASTTVTGTVAVTDNAGSLTVDAPVATPVFVRLSDGAAAIATLPVSLASVPSHAVTNAGTFAVQAAEADGANVTLGAKADAKSTATDTTAISAMSVLKQISASVQAPPSQAVTNAGTFSVQSSAVVPGTAATNLGKAEDAVHASGDTGVMSLGVSNEANTQFGADGDYTPIGLDREGSSRIIGNRVHDAVDAGAPVKMGAKAVAHGTNPTAVAAADRTDLYANRAGIPFVIGGHPNIITLEAAYTAAQTDASIITVSAGTKIVVTAIDVVCDNANTVAVAVRVGFGTTTTPTTTGVVLTHPGVAAGSGISRGNGGGMLGVGADDADLRITCGVPTTGSIRVLVTYYTIES